MKITIGRRPSAGWTLAFPLSLNGYKVRALVGSGLEPDRPGYLLHTKSQEQRLWHLRSKVRKGDRSP